MVEIDLFLCASRKSLGFSVSIEMDLVLKVGEIDSISVWGIGINSISVQILGTAWFLCGGRKCLVSSVWIEIPRFLCRGFEIFFIY